MAGVLIGRDPQTMWSVCWACKLCRPRFQLTMPWGPLKPPVQRETKGGWQ
jgi:hypothetical protein